MNESPFGGEGFKVWQLKKKKKKNSYKTWTWLQTPTMNWYQHNIFSSFKLLLLIWIVFDEKYPQLTAGVHCPGWLKHRLATDKQILAI